MARLCGQALKGADVSIIHVYISRVVRVSLFYHSLSLCAVFVESRARQKSMALVMAGLSRLPPANCVLESRRYSHQQQQRHRGGQQPRHKIVTTNEHQSSQSKGRERERERESLCFIYICVKDIVRLLLIVFRS